MLLINGALAAFNGFLVATCKAFCECVRGGIYCGGVCRCPDENNEPQGQCCGDTWINSDGTIDGLEGEWVCCNDSNGVILFKVPALADPGCSLELFSRCCTDGVCTVGDPAECLGEVLFGSCERFGCPKSCCTETSEGVVSCDTVDELTCGGTVDPNPCEDACKGACCFDGIGSVSSDTGEPDGPVTQAECEERGGCWQGPGVVDCEFNEDQCRPPFDADCCESVVSSAARLTFRGPRKRRCPEIDCGFTATVTVTTGRPTYIHGGLFGSPYEACTDTTFFTLCNDEFYVTPAPCSGSLENLDIEVCWGTGGQGEVLRFRCCQDITHLLGNCDCDCTTRVLYEDESCTSNAAFVMNGNAIIEVVANPSANGPLVLTSNFTQSGSCERTLTLTGDSTQLNELAGIIQNASGGTKVDKTGPGTWMLSADSPYGGRLRVLDGTLVVGSDVLDGGNSPFGSSLNADPILGSDASSGTAAMLFRGVGVGRSFSVSSGSGQVAVIGNLGTGTTELAAQVTLNRSVTLQSSSGGVLEVSTAFDIPNPAISITIGSAGNDGTVAFLATMGVLNYTGTTSIVAGTLVVETIVSGPPNVSSSTFTPTTLVVEFTATPSSGEQYQLLPGATAQTYASVTLNGAGGATGTYDSATSTLTID